MTAQIERLSQWCDSMETKEKPFERIEIVHNAAPIQMWIYSGGEAVSEWIRSTKDFYEVDFLRFLRQYYPHQETILDIGANLGNHAVYFAMFLCRHVICFEPVEANVRVLKENMKNRSATIHPVALSDKASLRPMYNSQWNHQAGYSLFRHVESFQVKRQVRTVTLDSFHLQDKITLIKIDVENHELPVLEGARQTIVQHRPIVCLENLHHLRPDRFAKDQFDDFFKSVDYVIAHSNVCGSLMDIWIPQLKPASAS